MILTESRDFFDQIEKPNISPADANSVIQEPVVLKLL